MPPRLAYRALAHKACELVAPGVPRKVHVTHRPLQHPTAHAVHPWDIALLIVTVIAVNNNIRVTITAALAVTI